MAENKSGIMETKALQPITAGEKQSWTSIMFIWMGGMISIPLLMVGAMMSQFFTLGTTLLLTGAGFAVAIAMMCLTGSIASDLGLPASVIATKGFGEMGSRLLISILIAVVQIGWFGIQTAMCAAAFVVLMNFVGVSFPFWLAALVWGIVMFTTAVYGYKLLKILNYIGVPALIAACLYAIFVAFALTPDVNIFEAVPPLAGQMSETAALSMMIGAFAMGTIVVCDIARYAKSRMDTVKSSFLGVMPATLFMMFAGGATAAATGGTGDITMIFVHVGMPFFGMVVLIIATWTTNTTNAYTGGLAIMKIFNLKDDRRPWVTMACGLLGTALAMVGIMEAFQGIIATLGGILPPVAGVLIADYWIVGKAKKENFCNIPNVNWIGILSWAAGATVGLFFSFFSPALDGIVVAIILYTVLTKFFGASTKTA